MWVRVPEWTLVESGHPRPAVGSLLAATGVRLRGRVTPADNRTPDGIEEVIRDERTDRTSPIYALTGTASSVRDVWRGDQGSHDGEHAGAELVLSVGPIHFQVQFDASASTVVANSRVTATGDLVLVAEYEWEAFDLTDTRADWRVTAIAGLPHHADLVDVQHPVR